MTSKNTKAAKGGVAVGESNVAGKGEPLDPRGLVRLISNDGECFLVERTVMSAASAVLRSILATPPPPPPSPPQATATPSPSSRHKTTATAEQSPSVSPKRTVSNGTNQSQTTNGTGDESPQKPLDLLVEKVEATTLEPSKEALSASEHHTGEGDEGLGSQAPSADEVAAPSALDSTHWAEMEPPECPLLEPRITHNAETGDVDKVQFMDISARALEFAVRFCYYKHRHEGEGAIERGACRFLFGDVCTVEAVLIAASLRL